MVFGGVGLVLGESVCDLGVLKVWSWGWRRWSSVGALADAFRSCLLWDGGWRFGQWGWIKPLGHGLGFASES